MLFDAKKYKEAKILVKDLTVINRLLETTIKAFIKYRKYESIKEVIDKLRDARFIVNLHLKKQKKIVRTKGEINGE